MIKGLETKATKKQIIELLGGHKFEHLSLGQTDHFKLYLNVDQEFLGRSYAWYTGRHIDLQSTSALSEVELLELHHNIVPAFEAAVKNLWGATHVNQAWFGNETHVHRGHGHLHLVPRYFERMPWFHGGPFQDIAIGRNYVHGGKFLPSSDLLYLIRDALRKELKLHLT